MTRDASLRASAKLRRSDSNAAEFSLHSPRRSTYNGRQNIGERRSQKLSNCSSQDTAAMLDSSVINVRQSTSQICSTFSAKDSIGHQQTVVAPCFGQGLRSTPREDYRQIIDDLTVELQRLKKELRVKKAQRPQSLRYQQVFEIKINNLSKSKRRELEATLSGFASSLDNSNTSQPKISRRRVNQLSCSNIERLLLSSKSGSRPLDSAYASMSADRNSGARSPNRVSRMEATYSVKQKVEKYLDDIPEDLCQIQGVIPEQGRSDGVGDSELTFLRDVKQERHQTNYHLGDSRNLAHEPELRPQYPVSLNRFHYKPLFVHHNSLNGSAVLVDALSLFGSDDDGCLRETGYTYPQKRHREGSIIYYHDASFCIDLSTDSIDRPQAEDAACNVRNVTTTLLQLPCKQPGTHYRASEKNSRLNRMPLAMPQVITEERDSLELPEEYVEESDNADFQISWAEEQPQYLTFQPLEPCGIGNVLPDDHFTIYVTTSRTKKDACWIRSVTGQGHQAKATNSTPLRAFRLPHQRSWNNFSGAVEIEYMDVRIKHLMPASLPLPVCFFTQPNTFDSADDYTESSEQGETHLSSMLSGALTD